MLFRNMQVVVQISGASELGECHPAMRMSRKHSSTAGLGAHQPVCTHWQISVSRDTMRVQYLRAGDVVDEVALHELTGCRWEKRGAVPQPR